MTGRPTKYKAAYNEQAKKLCKLGATDVDLAEFFGVNPDTIYEWKNKYVTFSEALKEAKDELDKQVEKSLYNRAMGYTHESEKLFYDKGTGEVVRAATKEHYPPDATSMIFWLKNRQPTKWRDKQEHEVSGPGGKDLSIVVNLLPSVAPDGNKS